MCGIVGLSLSSSGKCVRAAWGAAQASGTDFESNPVPAGKNRDGNVEFRRWDLNLYRFSYLSDYKVAIQNTIIASHSQRRRALLRSVGADDVSMGLVEGHSSDR